MSKNTEEQHDKQGDSRYEHLKAWQYKKGQSGNPGGRVKGKKTMKTYIREKFERMSPEEREEFMEGLDKKVVWEMAEGKAKQDNVTEHKFDSSLIGLIKGNNEPEATD